MGRRPQTEVRRVIPVFWIVWRTVTVASKIRNLVARQTRRSKFLVGQKEEIGLLLVRQYRHACGDWLVELPAGRLEPGEDTLTAAKRELEEETGFRAESWELLRAFFPAPGFCSELITLYLATELVAVEGGGLECDSDEEFDYVRLAPEELLTSYCSDAKTLLAAALLQLRARG